MKRCSICVMPESVHGLTFDERGACSFCREYTPETYRGRESLDDLVSRVRTRGGLYDCMVPVSGGRDSAYVLYYVVKELKLKPIAFHWDNGFDTDQALLNMKNMCQSLGVVLETVRSKWNTQKKIVGNRMRYSLDKNIDSFATSFCWACNFGARAAIKLAVERYGIPLVFMGMSRGEATQSMERSAGTAKQASLFKKLTSPHFIGYSFAALKLKREFPIKGTGFFSRTAFPAYQAQGSTVISLFDYIPWNRQTIKSAIIEHLGWRAPHGSISTWKIDCYFNTLTNYLYIRKFGCTKTCFGYTRFINSGNMTREEALAQENAYLQSLGDFEQIREILQNKVGLSYAETQKAYLLMQ